MGLSNYFLPIVEVLIQLLLTFRFTAHILFDFHDITRDMVSLCLIFLFFAGDFLDYGFTRSAAKFYYFVEQELALQCFVSVYFLLELGIDCC